MIMFILCTRKWRLIESRNILTMGRARMQVSLIT